MSSHRPIQNRTQQSTGKSARRPWKKYPRQKSVSPDPDSLIAKQESQLSDCKVWSYLRKERTTDYIKSMIDPKGVSATLFIPDSANPWNIVKSVVNQFYDREKDIAWGRYDYRKAIAIRDKQENRIKELEKELEATYNKLSSCQSDKAEKYADGLKHLEDLLFYGSAKEWVDIMFDIIDDLIMVKDEDRSEMSLYNARMLQRFFIALQKEDTLK